MQPRTLAHVTVACAALVAVAVLAVGVALFRTAPPRAALARVEKASPPAAPPVASSVAGLPQPDRSHEIGRIDGAGSYSPLVDAIGGIVSEAPTRSPGTELGIAAMNLSTGEYAGWNDDTPFVSLSAAKVMWVAAAMLNGAKVDDIAPPIFVSSSNELAGVAIDRAGGIDTINSFYANVFNTKTTFCAKWRVGKLRHATEQGSMGGDNYFVARDVIKFLAKLDRGELLDKRTDELKRYMRLSPRQGLGGWLGTLLPAEARARMMHKAGWDFSSADSSHTEIGIIEVPNGDHFAIAVLTRKGKKPEAEARYIEHASCAVYRGVARDASLRCRD